MNQAEVQQIALDAAAVFTGLRFGKVFTLGKASLAIDLFPHAGEYLYVNCDPRVRSCYLITRRLKDLERMAIHPPPFIIQMGKLLSGSMVRSISGVADADRVIKVELIDREGQLFALVIQLGGRPNVLIIDEDGVIVGALRDTGGNEHAAGQRYVPPPAAPSDDPVRETNGLPLSEVLDSAERKAAERAEIERLAAEARRKINSDIVKRQRLIANLENDLSRQGNADEWKRYGDLILANMATLRKENDTLLVTDHYDPEQREIAIPIEKDLTPKEAAESFFRRYTKARNGAAEIAKRMETVRSEIEKLKERRAKVEASFERRDVEFLQQFVPDKKAPEQKTKKRDKQAEEFKGARRFISSDGFEILVGKRAVDNDQLTFRIAKSLDLWLHAADYPGSHVVVRIAGRKDVPTRTLTEAAQLAAFYSDAREQPKAAVRYTQRKFVNKPKRAAPGLVSLASFKTILVEPKITVESKATD